mgnify:CR=1 FL=1
MYRFIPVWFVAFLFLSGCNEYHFSSVENEKSYIEAQQDDFFILKYVSWKECDIGGTLNEIAIRNDGSTPLLVEEIQLSMIKGGSNVTVKDVPRIYTDHVISDRATRVDTRLIPPGKWLYFAFPIDDCNKLDRSDELEYKFHVVLSAGDKRYENEAAFKKVVTSSPAAWL